MIAAATYLRADAGPRGARRTTGILADARLTPLARGVVTACEEVAESCLVSSTRRSADHEAADRILGDFGLPVWHSVI